MASLRPLIGEGAILLRPVIALNLWTFAMEAWMYATRIPAISKYKISGNPNTIQHEMETKIPPSIKWKADNYNHLFEQPTQFYAVAISLALLGVHDPTTSLLAWSYVGIRVVHSFVQATSNTIMVRFGLFATSSIVLLGMTALGAMEVF